MASPCRSFFHLFACLVCRYLCMNHCGTESVELGASHRASSVTLFRHFKSLAFGGSRRNRSQDKRQQPFAVGRLKENSIHGRSQALVPIYLSTPPPLGVVPPLSSTERNHFLITWSPNTKIAFGIIRYAQWHWRKSDRNAKLQATEVNHGLNFATSFAFLPPKNRMRKRRKGKTDGKKMMIEWKQRSRQEQRDSPEKPHL